MTFDVVHHPGAGTVSPRAGATPSTDDLTALDRHGDADVTPGMLDFAVNVRGDTPQWLRAILRDRLEDIARYPAAEDHRAAVDAVGARHGRPDAEILLLAGAAEGFALLPQLHPRRVALIQPSFTEPERVLRAAGVDIVQVVLSDPWELDSTLVPEDADMVLLGNPTNPTSVSHPRSVIESLRRPGRIIVVDEAFADIVPGEPHSLASHRLDDVVVIRSITKTFALAGLRAGYLLAAQDVIARLASARPHWPLGTLQLAAIEASLRDRGHAYACAEAEQVTAERTAMIAALRQAGVEVCGNPSASFVVVRVPDAISVKARLAHRGVAVRSCANFVGMTDDHLRLAVRDGDSVAQLLATWKDVT